MIEGDKRLGLMGSIPYDEVRFHPHSFGDPDGRLFSWNGRLYRAISREKTPFFRRLFEDGILQKLIDQGLIVRTEPTDLALDGYGLVLIHHRVPFVSYPHEWCAAMFKDAARAYLDLHRELLQYGLTLKDTHPWNLLFEATKPIYVDVNSIRPCAGDTGHLDYNEFCQYYLHPLTLMGQGQERIVRFLLPDYEGILPSDFSTMARISASRAAFAMMSRLPARLRKQIPQRYRPWLERRARSIQSLRRKPQERSNFRLFLERLRREIEHVPLPIYAHTGSDNSEISRASLSPGDPWNPLEESLHQLISSLNPDSILTIGTETALPARLASLLGKTVVAFSKDSGYVTGLYLDARDRNLQLLPLIMDFTDPTPSRGLSSHVSIAAADRLRCDLVLALGVIRQLMPKHLRFDQIAEGLARFSKRWVIVDFPRDIPDHPITRVSWFTLETFVNVLGKRFANVSELQIGNHVLLFCEK